MSASKKRKSLQEALRRHHVAFEREEALKTSFDYPHAVSMARDLWNNASSVEWAAYQIDTAYREGIHRGLHEVGAVSGELLREADKSAAQAKKAELRMQAGLLSKALGAANARLFPGLGLARPRYITIKLGAKQDDVVCRLCGGDQYDTGNGSLCCLKGHYEAESVPVFNTVHLPVLP